MKTLIINTCADISANEVLAAIKAEGNVETKTDGTVFIIKGLRVHLVRIYTHLTGRKTQQLMSPTILLRK